MPQRLVGIAGVSMQEAACLGQILMEFAHRVGFDHPARQTDGDEGHDSQEEERHLPHQPRGEAGRTVLRRIQGSGGSGNRLHEITRLSAIRSLLDPSYLLEPIADGPEPIVTRQPCRGAGF